VNIADIDGLLTLDEAARYMSVSKVTLRRWTRIGILTCVRLGSRGDRRFRSEDLQKHIANATIGQFLAEATGTRLHQDSVPVVKDKSEPESDVCELTK
jgi:excisionase family DNA binding protein